VRKRFWIGVAIIAEACGANVTTAPPAPPRTIGRCTVEVLSLPPQTPYLVLGQGYSDNMTDARLAKTTFDAWLAQERASVASRRASTRDVR